MLIGAFFDFFDGFFARLLKVSSDIGKQLDSLADLITFGVAPSIIVMHILLFQNQDNVSFSNIYFVALIIPIFSALRLAKFNVSTNQDDSFIGLPTPANALFFISIPFIQLYQKDHILNNLFSNSYILASLIVCFSLSMVSSFKLLSLKFKTFNWQENLSRYILIFSSIILLSFLHFVAVPIIILLYPVISLLKKQNEIQS